MHIEQLYTVCLSEAAYYIESEGEAAIVDPLRDIDVYLELAKKRNATIKYIFETHFHADFVSGHIDLSKATGAPIVYGPQTRADYKIYIAQDGEQFSLGKVKIEVLHTPGHTLESSCFLLKDESGKDYAVFTGDTLFAGDVGRPDLAQKGNQLTMDDLAGMLYRSIQKKIMPLADDVIVFPGHGPGSSCGKNIGPNTQSTIGIEKQTNYALKPQTEEDFIAVVTEGLNEPPPYFSINARINKEGYENLETVIEKALKPLALAEFKSDLEDEQTVLLDTRPAPVFMEGFVPGSISIGLEGRFAEWAGSILPFNKSILLVTEKGQERESVIRLARVGFTNFAGYLEGGFETWQATEEIDLVINVEADEVAMDLPFDENMVIVDVRKEIEFADGHVKNAVNIPLDTLIDPGTLADIEETDNLYIHCASGYRSVIAASLIKKQGIHNIRNIHGGFKALQQMEQIKIEKSPEVLN